MSDEPFWQRPRPPIESPITRGTELPTDPNHPTFDDGSRFFIERHYHQLQHDRLDEFEVVTVTAVYVDNGLTGHQIEFGPWSLSPEDARALATSLQFLAHACDGRTEQ